MRRDPGTGRNVGRGTFALSVLVAIMVAFVLAACERGGQAPADESVAAESPTAADELPVEEEELPPLPEEPETEQDANEPTTADPEAGGMPEPSQVAQAPAPARDLAAELNAAVGSPVECLQDYRPANSMVIRVDISAIVRSSGLVIEPTASASGLSANDRRCIERRVGDVVLSPFDSPASRPISTYVELSYVAPAAKEYDVGAPTPELKDVVEPLPKKPTIPRSGTPIDTAPFDRPDGPKGLPPDGPKGRKITGPKPKPIDGYEVDEDAEIWTDD